MRCTAKAPSKDVDLREHCGTLTLKAENPNPDSLALETELLSRLYREINLHNEAGSLLMHLRKVQDEGVEIKYVKPRRKS